MLIGEKFCPDLRARFAAVAAGLPTKLASTTFMCPGVAHFMVATTPHMEAASSSDRLSFASMSITAFDCNSEIAT